MHIRNYYLSFLLLFFVQAGAQKKDAKNDATSASSQVWSVEKANTWYKEHQWITGANFLPSTAINQLEMWQAETFDPATIDKELGWAKELGFNTVRTFLHDLAWQADPSGLK